MKTYNHKEIEKKWKENWEKNPINTGTEKPKYYCLDMFPYPSAEGLHVGHWRGYVFSDVISRLKIMEGYQVLHPMGFDAFGLPTENYAIKENIHPIEITEKAAENYRRQLKEIGAVYDWSKEINTTDPGYYKWTQWIFLKMYEQGLAYEKEMPLNWCPACKIVKANEEIEESKCERCKTTTTKKMLRQWMLKITNYADRLLDDLEKLDWPGKVKKMQSDWIGKSRGAKIFFPVNNMDARIEVFTTRPDTIYGATFMVLAPEHSLVAEITTAAEKESVEAYIQETSSKSTIERMADKEKTGVFTGGYCANPLSKESMPVWIADYVLPDYGTGAVMAVPAHDERDFEFAVKYNLEIKRVITGGEENRAYTGEGLLINSGSYNGQESPVALANIIKDMEKAGVGKGTINFKLRDWVFSRQRYWGEPIPLVHCKDCGIVPVPEEDLPVLLPENTNFKPTDTGESPLAHIEEFVNTTCPKCRRPAKRETNTMPQWAGSSWYFLRYPDPHNSYALADGEILKDFLPVDMYVGGVEHAVLHLLYARFYTKFLYDIGVVDFEEPFVKLFNQGMIYRDGAKMSKSLGNVVSPDEIIEMYGTDTLRMYQLFIGPPELDAEWDDSGIKGVYRFLNSFYKLVQEYKDKPVICQKQDILKHKLIHQIRQRAESFSFNTVISGFMEYTNKISALAREKNGIDPDFLKTMIKLMAPFAPFIAEELWEELGYTTSIFDESRPNYDPAKIVEETVEIALQINGKLRGTLEININEEEETIIARAKEQLRIERDIVKEIYVPDRIVNFVVKQ